MCLCLYFKGIMHILCSVIQMLCNEVWKENHVDMQDVLNPLLKVKNFQEMRIMKSVETKRFSREVKFWKAMNLQEDKKMDLII